MTKKVFVASLTNIVGLFHLKRLTALKAHAQILAVKKIYQAGLLPMGLITAMEAIEELAR